MKNKKNPDSSPSWETGEEQPGLHCKYMKFYDMKKEKIKLIFSEQRLSKFIERFAGDFDKAVALYKLNIDVSKAFYPLLSVIEIALRNSIYRALSKNKAVSDWTENFSPYHDLLEEISKSTNQIQKRKEKLNDGKLIAELTLGFWTTLFNSKYEMALWKSLRLAFPYMPKKERQRKNISAPLNRIRKFRNRIFHYEPIIWSVSELEKIKIICYDLLEWLDEDLPEFAKEIENIDRELLKLRELYK